MIVVNDGSTDATAAIAREYGFRVISSREPRPEPRPERGPACGVGRDRRLHRRRRLSRPGLAAIPRRRLPRVHARGHRRPEPPAARRRAGGRERGQRAGRADPRPALRSGGRAHPGLQHGVPARARSWRSAASIRSSGPPATTWTSAGGCGSGAGRSGSTRAPWSGITGATRCAPTGSSRWATAGRRRCSSASGRRSTTAPATSAGRGASTGWGSRGRSCPGAARGCTRAPGASALFQSLYRPAPGVLAALPLMPEWYLAILLLALLSALGVAWPPLLVALPLLGARGGRARRPGRRERGARALHGRAGRTRSTTLKLYGLTALLYLLQPMARLRGRLAHGLTPWRRRGTLAPACRWRRTCALWRERGRTAAEHLADISEALRAVRGGRARGRRLRPVGSRGATGGARRDAASSWRRRSTGRAASSCASASEPWVPPAWLVLVALGVAVAAGAAASRAWLAAVTLRACGGPGRDPGAVRQRPGHRRGPARAGPARGRDARGRKQIEAWQEAVERVA